jgi:hypothetical protein
LPAQATACAIGVQPQVWLAALQVSGATQVSGQATIWPQLFATPPHSPPAQVVVMGSGRQPHTPLTPPPPQLAPAPVQVPPQSTVCPQLLTVGPHLPPAQVVVAGSSVHEPHWPLVASQPKAQGMSGPHCPAVLQVSVAAPLQRCAPGVHTPAHWPVVASHKNGQGLVVYLASAPQCFALGPGAQASLPGTHSPMH